MDQAVYHYCREQELARNVHRGGGERHGVGGGDRLRRCCGRESGDQVGDEDIGEVTVLVASMGFFGRESVLAGRR